jgi:hypothetical protein
MKKFRRPGKIEAWFRKVFDRPVGVRIGGLSLYEINYVGRCMLAANKEGDVYKNPYGVYWIIDKYRCPRQVDEVYYSITDEFLNDNDKSRKEVHDRVYDNTGGGRLTEDY